MKTKNEIFKEIILTLEDKLDFIDGVEGREEEVMDLEMQIHALQSEICKKEQSEYLKQLKAFQNYMTTAFDVLMGDACTDESVDVFYNSDFTLTFRGQSITLYNGAEMWNGISDIIQAEIDDCEEV